MELSLEQTGALHHRREERIKNSTSPVMPPYPSPYSDSPPTPFEMNHHQNYESTPRFYEPYYLHPDQHQHHHQHHPHPQQQQHQQPFYGYHSEQPFLSPPFTPARLEYNAPQGAYLDSCQQPPQHYYSHHEQGPSHQSRSITPEEAGSTGEKEEKKRAMPFLEKLRHLLTEENTYADCLRWDTKGECFIVVASSERLQSEVLPSAYQHNNYCSFTRQLNVYGFRRMSPVDMKPLLDYTVIGNSGAQAHYHGWRHAKFQRDNVELSYDMKPRISPARRLALAEKLKKKEFQRKMLPPGDGN